MFDQIADPHTHTRALNVWASPKETLMSGIFTFNPNVFCFSLGGGPYGRATNWTWKHKAFRSTRMPCICSFRGHPSWQLRFTILRNCSTLLAAQVTTDSTEENKTAWISQDAPQNTHTYIHTYIHTSIHTYVHTYTYTYIHTHAHAHTRKRPCSHGRTCTRAHTRAHSHTNACISVLGGMLFGR